MIHKKMKYSGGLIFQIEHCKMNRLTRVQRAFANAGFGITYINGTPNIVSKQECISTFGARKIYERL